MKGKKLNINNNDDIGKKWKEERMKDLKSKEKKNNSESVDIKHNRWKIEKQFSLFSSRTVREHISIILHK